MHSFGYRFNTLLTLAILLLAVLCALASVCDNFNRPTVQAHAEVLKVNRFRKQLNGNDEVSFTLSISMDLQSTFTWNTKQVFVFLAAEYETAKNSLNQISLWDHIILSKDQAKIQMQVSNKYPFVDQGSNLRGKKVKLILHWHVMPKTCRMIEGSMILSDFDVPLAYT
ncbi:signal peptidase complex subunit 3A-like [Aristolochia californica]|uniref:signal peptidase complex subunit 3A-like n=1 Tax=Aristolochia californica TaxID=171875 RepID=UPI0035DFFF5E